MRVSPDGGLTEVALDNDEHLRAAVGGWLAVCPTRVAGWSFFCDDEALCKDSSVFNPIATLLYGGEIRGPIVVFRPGPDGSALPLSPLDRRGLERLVAQAMEMWSAYVEDQGLH